MQESSFYPSLDLKKTISSNRLVGLWRLLGGFRLLYLGAIVTLAVATAAKTVTYLLLRYFVDEALLATPESGAAPFWLIAVGFVALAVLQGGFTFISGKFAARSAEGAILRLRNYLFDHIQRLSFTYHDHAQTGELVQKCSSDVDMIRRFFCRTGHRTWPDCVVVHDQLRRAAVYQRQASPDIPDFDAGCHHRLDLLFQKDLRCLRRPPKPGRDSIDYVTGESERSAGGQSLCPARIRNQ